MLSVVKNWVKLTWNTEERDKSFGEVKKAFLEGTLGFDLEGEQYNELCKVSVWLCKVRHERTNHIPRMNFPITTHDWKTCRAKLHPVQTKPDANPESPNRLPIGGRDFKPCQTLQNFSLAPISKEDLFQFSSLQSLSRVRLFATPWIAARQASLSITSSRSSLRLTSIKSVMPSSHLILCHPLHLLPPIPPSIRVFSNESTLRMRWPKYWSFSFSVIPSKEIPGLISFRMD